jgi:tetratricopeptide (TPR) repeat protein
MSLSNYGDFARRPCFGRTARPFDQEFVVTNSASMDADFTANAVLERFESAGAGPLGKFCRSFVEGTFDMSVDIYAPCPCGSGKKFKFCCSAIADDMDRISRLMEGNQPRVALQQLEIVDRKHPKNAWVGTTRVMLLLDQNEDVAARDLIRHVLEAHPDNELAIVLNAIAMIRSEGHDQAKKAIHRAFQKSAKKLPWMVSDLAAAIAGLHMHQTNLLAAREHLALALRLAPEQRRQELFVQLLELDGAEEIPYPIRGTHILPTINGSEDLQKEVRKAQKYSAVGCWSVAADLFTTLANAEPERGELWHSAGLCRAWDGDEKTAAECLHRAARHYADHGIAVECETLAQLLDGKTTQDVIDECYYSAKVASVSRLLSVFDKTPKLLRVKLTGTPEFENDPVEGYSVLDRECPEPVVENYTYETTPRVIGRVVTRDADPKRNLGALLVIEGMRGAKLDDAKTLLTAAAGDLLEWVTEGTQPEVSGSVPAESESLITRWYIPSQFHGVQRRQIMADLWTTTINEKWRHQKMRSLEGKTPEQAAGDPSLRVPLTAAIYLLDATAARQRNGAGLLSLLQQYNLEPLPQIDVTAETPLSGLSIMQLHRLPIDRLTDQQLVTVVNRSMLIRHDESLHRVLTAAVERPACAEQLDLPRIFRLLSEIASGAGKRDEAFSWIDRGRKLPVPEGKSAFQNAWAWDMLELGLRMEDPSDPLLKTMLNRVVTYYAPKVPQIRPHIEETLAAIGIPSPWESLDLVTPAGAPASGGIWSPDSTEPVSTAGKLWVPGQ